MVAAPYLASGSSPSRRLRLAISFYSVSMGESGIASDAVKRTLQPTQPSAKPFSGSRHLVQTPRARAAPQKSHSQPFPRKPQYRFAGRVWSLNDQKARSETDKNLNDEEMKYSKWQSEFEEAIVELNPERLADKIKHCELAVFVRLQELAFNSDHHDERQAIADALSILREVKRDRLSYPDWKS